MARTKVTSDWGEVMTTTVDTLMQVEGGPVRFQTSDTTGVNEEDGVKVNADSMIVFPAGLTISAVTRTEGVYVIAIPFGV